MTLYPVKIEGYADDSLGLFTLSAIDENLFELKLDTTIDRLNWPGLARAIQFALERGTEGWVVPDEVPT